jgi:hypothetical protein
MVLITLKPGLARLLISDREGDRLSENFERVEKQIQEGGWDKVSPIWLTPNYLINGLFGRFAYDGKFKPTLKPFIVYNGHHRLDKAIEHNLPVRAYVRFTPFNPKMPETERLQFDIDG